MYKNFIISIFLSSALACTADTKNTEVFEAETFQEIEKKKIETIKEEENNTEIIEEKVEDITTEEVAIVPEIKEEKEVIIKKEIKETVEEVIPEPIEVVAYSPSHSAFDAMLKKHVSTNGNVNYAGFKADKPKLDEYLQVLAKNEPTNSFTREEKLAYWINLYNAGTIQLILKNYPVKSIMNINNGKAWDLKFIKSGDRTLSLNQIENEIIRPTFKDPRIHFAVNCAAVSCPKLLNGAFLAHILDKQLDTATQKFINNKAKNTISESSIQISKIFEWYADDFGGKSNLINFFNKYSTITIKNSATVSFNEYKWELNK